MESAMITMTAEEILHDKAEETIAVSPDTTIHEAAKLIMPTDAHAVLIKKEGKYVGIWTERDLMKNTATEGFNPMTAKVGDYMSSPLITTPHTDTVYQLIDKFLGLRIRHLIVEKKGEYIGLLYARDVIRAGLTERSKELDDLSHMVSWEYYEDWKWKKKHK